MSKTPKNHEYKNLDEAIETLQDTICTARGNSDGYADSLAYARELVDDAVNTMTDQTITKLIDRAVEQGADETVARFAYYSVMRDRLNSHALALSTAIGAKTAEAGFDPLDALYANYQGR